MTRHLSDKPRTTAAGRLRHFLQHERESGDIHPAIAALHARSTKATPEADRRVAEFTRIERGHRA